MNWKDQVVLFTGGTGSFGKKFIKILLEEKQPKKVIIFSRDELKQHEMQVGGYNQENLRYSCDNNSEWLDVEGIKKYISPFEELFAQGKLEG